jgi:chromate reductase, NAD(P)H dehydrogenase (quinone)
MNQYRIAIIVGSLRRDSINRQLADAVARLAPQHFKFKQLQIGDVPLYNQDDEAEPVVAVKRLKTELSSAQGVVFVTPEYNRSVPGVMKNAIDAASRPYGQNAWARKPAGILSASMGPIGAAMAQQHLRNILAYLDMPTLAQPEAFMHVTKGFFDASGGIAAPDTRKFLQSWMDRYAEWVIEHATS